MTHAGTGGLVRAYTDATKAGLAQCKTAIMSLGKRVKIYTDYNTIGKVLYELGQRGLGQEESEYVIDKPKWQEPATLECLQIVRYNDIILKKEKRF
ncbi:MAG: hypothetical protein R3Y24_14150 [Eubacteriales bacterium]